MFAARGSPPLGPLPPGGQNMPAMLKAQNAMYWHADFQALVTLAFFVFYVIHTEVAMNGNVVGEQYVCRRRMVSASCSEVHDLYPFLTWRGGLNAMRVLMSLASLATAASIVLYHSHKLALLRHKGTVSPAASLRHFPLNLPLLFELCLCAMHPFPWLEEITANSNVFLFLFAGACSRLYILLRCFFFHSSFNSNSSRFIASLSGISFSSVFVLRAYLYLHPVRTITSLTAGLFLVSSYLLRVFENVGCAEGVSLQCSPIDLADAMWIVAITMLCIGYRGTFTPISSPARILMAGLGGLSVSVVLMNVVVILVAMQLSDTEECVLHTWTRLRNKVMEKSVAVSLLQRLYRYHTGYFRSLKWAETSYGVKYRVVSQRVPLENLAVVSLQKFHEMRLDLKRQSLDEDYAMVKRIMASKALHDMQDLMKSLRPFLTKIMGQQAAALALIEAPNIASPQQQQQPRRPQSRTKLQHHPSSASQQQQPNSPSSPPPPQASGRASTEPTADQQQHQQSASQPPCSSDGHSDAHNHGPEWARVMTARLQATAASIKASSQERQF